MSFLLPINQDPYNNFRQGPFEPEDVSDSSPLKLYLLCAKYVVKNITKINFNCKLPSEICDNLIEVFRLYGTKKLCTRFLNSISNKQCRVVNANLSGLDINNEEFIDFLDAHSQSLRVLNISNCTKLSSDILFKINQTLTRVKDSSNLYRMVTVYEVPYEQCNEDPYFLEKNRYPFVLKKMYHNGTYQTHINKYYPTACEESYYKNSFFLQREQPRNYPPRPDKNVLKFCPASEFKFTVTCSKVPHTDYELHKEMGMFFDPEFTAEYFREQPYAIACYDKSVDDNNYFNLLNNLNQYNMYQFIRANQIIRSKDNGQERSQSSNGAFSSDSRCVHCQYESGSTQKQKFLILPKRLYFTFIRSDLVDIDNNLVNQMKLSTNQRRLRRRRKNDNSGAENISDDLECGSLAAGSGLGCSAFSANSVDPISQRYHSQQSDYTMLADDLMDQIGHAGNAAAHQLNDIADEEDVDIADESADRITSCSTNERASLPAQSLKALQRKFSSSASSTVDPVSASATSSSCPSLATCGMSSTSRQNCIFSPFAASSSSTSRYHQLRPHSHNLIGHKLSNVMCTSVASSSSGATASTSSSSHLTHDHDYYQMDSLDSSSSPTHSQIEAYCCPRHQHNYPITTADHSDLFLDDPRINGDNEFDDINRNIRISEDALRFQYFPYEVYRLHSPDYKFVRIVEIRTWTEPKLETLIVNRTAQPDKSRQFIFNPDFNNLKRLVINYWSLDIHDTLVINLSSTVLDRLTHLDLSNCSSVGDGSNLCKFRNLRTLILYNVPHLHKALTAIASIKTLRVLDISTANDSDMFQYNEPNAKLSYLITNLPKLVSLDISGTNLAGNRCDYIPGLESRISNPLEFLGIFNTSMDASYRCNIPAIKIAGDSLENLVLNSCEAYMDRVEMLRACLNELFKIFRYESGKVDLERSLKIIVCAFGKHPLDKLVQVAASATLFYIVKSDEAKPLLGKVVKDLIVTRLLDAMQIFRYDQTLLRNGCLNLIHFRIPADVISEYTRLADILLHIVTNDEDEFVQRLGIYLLNSLACQVDGEQKTIVGNLGAIEKMLQLIEIRFNRNICDEVMETAWSTMWNVTDETPINCERFLNNNGMEFFVSCMERFSNNSELLRNMMGLLGNVSECAHLRYRLMKEEYIVRFIQLLDSQSDGIEVSYNSAGILAHIASDGAEVWARHLNYKCSRDKMLKHMENAISRWEINSKRNINYRSFEPILRLLRVLSISWEAQYWAVWALANLTRVHCSKYCSLLEKDGGVEVLQSFIVAPRPDNFRLPNSVKLLAVVTLFQYYLYKRFGKLKHLDKSNEIMCFHLVRPNVVIDFLQKYDFKHLAIELEICCNMGLSKKLKRQCLFRHWKNTDIGSGPSGSGQPSCSNNNLQLNEQMTLNMDNDGDGVGDLEHHQQSPEDDCDYSYDEVNMAMSQDMEEDNDDEDDDDVVDGDDDAMMNQENQNDQVDHFPL